MFATVADRLSQQEFALEALPVFGAGHCFLRGLPKHSYSPGEKGLSGKLSPGSDMSTLSPKSQTGQLLGP